MVNNGFWLLIMDMETDCLIVKTYYLVSIHFKLSLVYICGLLWNLKLLKITHPKICGNGIPLQSNKLYSKQFI